jgi:oligopeptide transport system substrate-binding protein
MRNRGRTSPLSAAQVVSLALLTLVGLVAVSLAGCTATGSGQSGIAKDQTFTWPYVNATAVENPQLDVAVLDPAVITNAIDSSNIAMLYSGLVTLNSSTLQVEPDAALSWDVSADGKTYTFHLRPNMAFSDGTPITARDFAYSINRAIGPTPNASGQDLVCSIEDALTYAQDGNCYALGSTYLGMIQGASDKVKLTPAQAANYSLIGPGKGLEVVDPRTLIIRINQPAAYFLEALDYPSSFPVEQSLVQKFSGGAWVDHLTQGGCSGPFMVKSYARGNELQLVPNPYWETAWHKNLTLKEVDRPFLASQDTEYTNYHAKSLYDYTDVPAPQYTFAVGQSDFHQVASLTTDYIGLNFKVPPFDNQQVRQAFDLSLNKQLLIDRVYNGEFIPTNHIVPEGNPGYAPQLTGPDGTQSITGNQPQALKLLAEAQATCKGVTPPFPAALDYCPYIDNGANSSPIYLSAGVNTDATQKEVATIATQTWSQVLKLNVNIKAYDDLVGLEQVILAATGNTAQAWLIGWVADYPDAQDWLSLQFYSTAPNNLSYVNRPDLDQLMAQADSDQNPVRRVNEYNAIEQKIVDLCAWIPLDQEKTSWRLRPWVQGFGLNQVLLMEDADWPNVYILAH